MRQVLVIEDEVVLAMELESELRRVGFSVLGPIYKVHDALRCIAEQPPDIAILDVNLHEEKSVAVAEALLAARVPFVTLTGYSEQEVRAIYRGSPIMTKPYDMDALLAELDNLDRPTIGYQL
jgi:DNA-binding response OmpR family regulator